MSPQAEDWSSARRVLIYRLGSLGDTVVSLPCLHLIARAFPSAVRCVLTNNPVAGTAAALSTVLGDSGLADAYLSYPVGLRDPRSLWRLRRRIAAFAPDLLIYLTAPKSGLGTLRDRAFFRACGIRRVVGAPLTRDRRRHRFDPASGLWEGEAARLARCVAQLGDAALDDPASWDLAFTPREIREAAAALAGWTGAGDFIAFSAGTKWPGNDWGDANWRAALAAIGAAHPGLGLVALGAAAEAERCDRLAQHWPGPWRNLCGATLPRISALVSREARLLLGHDSGPMHLAAAVGTPTVAVFGGRSPPGVWFPHGAGHRVFYPGRDGGRAADGAMAIGWPGVAAAAAETLRAPRGRRRGAA